MRQLRDMSIMEIDITNACMHTCSNCTRFCGHHGKTYYMNFETFKRAVDSLEDFQGLISIIGGEPTLHPELNRFLDYLYSKGHLRTLDDGRSKAMVKDYLAYALEQRWFNLSYYGGRGYNLFTSVSREFYRNYEGIQDSITHMFLNDHTNPSFHQPALISRKDLGIGDEEFAQMREQCWLQNFWSASITPRGGFFCEIAGTLDLLFNGPGGVKIEPGWWKRDLSAFQDQFHWCDYCGMALQTYSRNANDGIDDVSPSLYKKLEELGSPKLKRGRVHLYQPGSAVEKDGMHIGEDMATVTANYDPDYEKRVAAAASLLRPQRICGVLLLNGEDICKQAQEICGRLYGKLDAFYAVVPAKTGETLRKSGIVDAVLDASATGVLGETLMRALWEMDEHDWAVLVDADTVLPDHFAESMRMRALNPGYLFQCRFGTEEKQNTIMLCKTASALRQAGMDQLRVCREREEIAGLWKEKQCELAPGFEMLPDVDIPYFRQTVYTAYKRDRDFCTRLKLRMEQRQPDRTKPIIVPHAALAYHTLSIVKMLQEMGYTVYTLASEKFRSHYQGWLEPRYQLFFEFPAFRYGAMQKWLEEIRDYQDWGGVLVPCSYGCSSLKPIDDYTDVLKCMSVLGEILGIVNIRRQFIEPEYNIWKMGEKDEFT